MRCFGCCGFDHTKKYCTKKIICAKCGQGSHKPYECDKKEKICPNYIEANNKGESFNANHYPFDLACPYYIK